MLKCILISIPFLVHYSKDRVNTLSLYIISLLLLSMPSGENIEQETRNFECWSGSLLSFRSLFIIPRDRVNNIRCEKNGHRFCADTEFLKSCVRFFWSGFFWHSIFKRSLCPKFFTWFFWHRSFTEGRKEINGMECNKQLKCKEVVVWFSMCI